MQPQVQKERGQFTMLNHEVSLGCLATYLGFTIGFGLLVASIFSSEQLGRWGIAVICVACTYSIHRSIRARDALLAQTYDLGRSRERERVQSIR